MSKLYLEVTFRRGKPFAAYLYLDRRAGDTAARSVRQEEFVVDYSADGRAIGVELIRLTRIDLASLNITLTAAKAAAIAPDDLVPLPAA